MLVLNRIVSRTDPRASVVLKLPDGRSVTLWLLDTANGKARFGIEAPNDVIILRGELHTKQAAETN